MADEGNRSARDAWLGRVLGADPGAARSRSAATAAPAAPRHSPLLPLWRDARDEVGTQLERLRAAMHASGVESIGLLADFGLNGITGRLQVGLTRDLLDYDAAAGRGDAAAAAQALARLRGGLGEWRAFLGADRVLPLLDGNPWGVAVGVRDTLGAALDAIEQALPA